MSEIKDKNKLIIKNSATIELERRKGFVNILLQGNPNLYRAWVERNNKIVIDISGESTEYNLDTETPDYIEIIKNQTDNKYYINFVGSVTGEGSLVSDDITFTKEGDNTRLTIKPSKFISTERISSGSPDYLYVNVDSNGTVSIGLDQEIVDKLESVDGINKYEFDVDISNDTLVIKDTTTSYVFGVVEFIDEFISSNSNVYAKVTDGANEYKLNCENYDMVGNDINFYFKKYVDVSNDLDIFSPTFIMYVVKLDYSSNTYDLDKLPTTRTPAMEGLTLVYSSANGGSLTGMLYKASTAVVAYPDVIYDYIKDRGIVTLSYFSNSYKCTAATWIDNNVKYCSLVFFEVTSTTTIIHTIIFNNTSSTVPISITHTTYDLSNL